MLIIPLVRNLALATAFWALVCPVWGQEKPATVSDDLIGNAQTITYCDLLQRSKEFDNRVVRVRALYLTNFEEATISAPACTMHPALDAWVEFDDNWESRTKRGVRRAIDHLRWGVQEDVVLVGKFSSSGSHGHMDMYTWQIDVYKVETAQPSGHFRELPEGSKRH